MRHDWTFVRANEASFEHVGARAAIGLVGLSVDRASVDDLRCWLTHVDGVNLVTTRVPMSPVADAASLAAMGSHLAEAGTILASGGRLDAMVFACTSGAIAIGIERVQAALSAAQPGVPVVTPIDAGASGLRALGATRISLLAPYHLEAAELVAGFFEAEGFALDRCSTFDLDGDLQMNRLTPTALKAAAANALDPRSDALFISCTGLRTCGIVGDLEAALGVPVVTSNQAMAWGCLSHVEASASSAGEGRLLELLKLGAPTDR